jgi:hypothetical protein
MWNAQRIRKSNTDLIGSRAGVRGFNNMRWRGENINCAQVFIEIFLQNNKLHFNPTGHYA